MMIEMECPTDKVQAVFDHVRKIHPYETIAIDTWEITKFTLN